MKDLTDMEVPLGSKSVWRVNYFSMTITGTFAVGQRSMDEHKDHKMLYCKI